MAKAVKKKDAKTASNTFHNIMAASVMGNPAPEKKKLSQQQKYIELYTKVQFEMKRKGFINETLMELCSVSLNKNSKQIDFEFILESPIDAKINLKNSFDNNSKKYGFMINYMNLKGDLY